MILHFSYSLRRNNQRKSQTADVRSGVVLTTNIDNSMSCQFVLSLESARNFLSKTTDLHEYFTAMDWHLSDELRPLLSFSESKSPRYKGIQIEYFPKNCWVFKDYLDLWKHTKKQNQKASFYTFLYKIKNKKGRELGLAPPLRIGKIPYFYFFLFLNPSLNCFRLSLFKILCMDGIADLHVPFAISLINFENVITLSGLHFMSFGINWKKMSNLRYLSKLWTKNISSFIQADHAQLF